MRSAPSCGLSASNLFLAGVLAACAAPAWAQTAEPEPGMWSFDGELDGRPGRSLHIDTQAGRTMAVSYLGYRADGSSFFLQAGATRPEGSSTFDGTLSEFRNGPVIGGGAGQGETAASAGPVKIVFDTPTSATVTLPGDTPRRISRYRYEDPAPRLTAFPIGVRSYAAVAAGSSDRMELSVKLQNGQFSMETANPQARLGFPRCSYTGPLQPAGSGVSSEGTYICTAEDGGQTSGAYRAEHFVMQADGLFRGTLWRNGERADLFGGCLGGAVMLGWPSLCNFGRSGVKTEPEPGIWGFEGEVNGRPGRSLQIDTQQGQAMVVTYVGYRPDGSALFLQAGGFRPAGDTAFSANLHEYRNGPVLGGSAGNGEPAADLGPVRITFDSATTGTVTLPGDVPRRIARFQYEDLTARFNQTYRVRHIGGSSVDGVATRYVLSARDGQFQLVRGEDGSSSSCTFSGTYRAAGRGIESSGTQTCNGILAGTYSDFRFEVDAGGHLVSYLTPGRPLDTGLCVRPDTSAAGGYRACSAEELGTR
ncbi:hypothetical protein M4R22_08595 [Acidovorax sp. GBBC 3334]|uniref:hypothetical protein n=1 Tax=Acidovorax sp. GBBC 3334 TaxID=2940496 RepID=UPI0023023125|nr:hypothetical protein [Acidovorax sp. GBBC 3334]MDA8454819.1 hypothetical protein [Acidovorax sp. GBBC 3334]